MGKSLRVYSYFSLPADLAGEMREWPEFVSGEGYDVRLRDCVTDEDVSVRYVEATDDPAGSEGAYIAVSSTAAGSLFDRVAGRVVIALSGRSDYLTVNRHDCIA